VKISELAKKVKMPAKSLLIQAIKSGVKAKSAQGALTAKDLDKVLKALAKKNPSLDIEKIKAAAAPVFSQLFSCLCLRPL